jgi:hypothetical protein
MCDLYSAAYEAARGVWKHLANKNLQLLLKQCNVSDLIKVSRETVSAAGQAEKAHAPILD